MTFKTGEINNPKGRPVGAKGKATLAKEKLMDLLTELLEDKNRMAKLGDKDLFKGGTSNLPRETKIDLKTEATKLVLEFDKEQKESKESKEDTK